MELIQDMDLEGNPLIFHVFSNGGCAVYRRINQLLLTDKSFSGIQVKGCIFDSCPGPRNLRSAFRALQASLQTHAVISYILGSVLVIYLIVARCLQWVVSFVRCTSDTSEDLWLGTRNDKSRWPQLFLYSKADHIIPYQCIDQLVEYRRGLGVDIGSQCWEDSSHVMHFRTHREAYVKQCYDFLDKCVGDW